MIEHIKNLLIIILIVIGIYAGLMISVFIMPIVIGYFLWVNRKLTKNKEGV